jgi:HAD superfamily hydrolase (TIGR01509 family)
MLFPIDPSVRAMIFDVDGTLADSMPVHLKAWKLAMQKWGGDISEEEFYGFAGVSTIKMIEQLNQRHGTNVPVEAGAMLKEQLYFDLIHEVPPIVPVVNVVKQYLGKMPIAIASGGRRYVVLQTLGAIDLAHQFDVMMTADDVVHGKPDPEMFLQAAKLMKVAPQHCLVWEDGEPGIVAAAAAKMQCIDVRKFGVTSSK